MSGAETARRRVVQRRIGGAEMALPHKDGHSQYCWNNILLILYRFLQWRFVLAQETQPNEVVGTLLMSTETITIFLLFFYLWGE